MRKRKSQSVVVAALGLFVFLVVAGLGFAAADVPRMTKDELKAKLGDPNIVVIDARAAGDWQKSDLKIKGAVREDPANSEAWVGKYPKDKTYVIYCA